MPIADRSNVLKAIQVACVDPDAEWDAFAAGSPGASLGHARGWQSVLAKAYGIDTLHFAARDATGRLRGILALARFHSLSGARSWVSLPFLDAAGVLAEDRDAEAALLGAAQALGGPVELRQSAQLATLPVDASSRVELILELGGGSESRWLALPAKVRNQTRKARKEGLDVGPPHADEIGEFHRLHCHNMRELGSPPHSERFFRSMFESFGERARCFIARDGRRAVGGLVAIEFAGVATVPWASTLASDRSRCPNSLLYWEAIRWAEERGLRAFSFGRSPWGSGTHRFKRGWGARDHPLHWLQLDALGHAAAAESAGDSRLLRVLSRVWKQLPPALCDSWGPHVRRRIAS